MDPSPALGGDGMNGYGRLSAIKADLKLVGTTYDKEILDAREAISRAIDHELKPRHFYSEIATRTFDTPGDAEPLYFGFDLVSATTVTIDSADDGAYETTLVAGTDYRLLPVNSSPKRGIELLTSRGQLSAWPNGKDALQVVGKWGYSDDVELTGATTSEAVDLTETVIDISDDTLVDRGDTIRIDSEDMEVTAVTAGTPDTMTVVRAINGTTAATHATSAAIYVRRYVLDIEQAVVMQVARYRWETQTGHEGAVMMNEGIGAGRSALYPMVRDKIRNLIPPDYGL